MTDILEGKRVKVLSIENDSGGCTFYRSILPMSAMAAMYPDAARSVLGRSFGREEFVARLENCSILSVPRLSTPTLTEACIGLKGHGIKITTDFDDNIFDVSPLSNHYQEFGTEEVYIERNGETIPLWVDGKNFSIKKNKELQDAVKRGLEAADLVTTTTDILANVFRQYNDNVVVIPNAVDLAVWKKLPLIRTSNEIRMGWFGGSSHYEDLLIIREVFPTIFARYPTLKFVYMGQLFRGIVKDWEERIEFYPWVHTSAYPYKAAILDLDFAVIPLKDTRFNSCKSAIKFIEMGALQVPSICSFVSPYQELYENNNMILVENDPEAWIHAIDKMIESLPAKEMANEAYNTVASKYAIDKTVHLWYNAYSNLLKEDSK